MRVGLATGVPVLTSPTSWFADLRDVTYQPADLEEGVRRLLEDTQLRGSPGRRGHERTATSTAGARSPSATWRCGASLESTEETRCQQRCTYPGVYIEEVPSGVRTIASVSTADTAFVDCFRRGPMNRAVRITSLADFQRVFGGIDRPARRATRSSSTS